MNKVNLLGRLTKDPEIETTVNNNLHARFTIAVDRRFAREGYQNVDFVPVSVWGKSAEFASMYFKKGMRVGISGRLEFNQYTDKATNQQRTFAQVTAEDLYFADGRKDAGSGYNQDPFAARPNQNNYVSQDPQSQFQDSDVDDVQFSDIKGDDSFNIENDPFETVDDVNFNE